MSRASTAASTEEAASFESCAWKQDSVLSFVNSRNSIVATEVIVADSIECMSLDMDVQSICGHNAESMKLLKNLTVGSRRQSELQL